MLHHLHIETGKVNLNYLNLINVTVDEIEAMFHPDADWYPAYAFGTAELVFKVIGYSTGRKFLCVIFDVSGNQIVIEDVYLPGHEEIKKHICP